MIDDRCVTSTETRSITVAPLISALCRISLGIHLPARPNTGSTVGVPGQRVEHVAEREHPAGRRLTAAGLDAGDPDHVGRRRQVDAVARAHRRHDDAEVERDLAAQRAHTGEQVVRRAAHDVDEVGREQ